jgi:hypothetical protein
MCKHPDYQKESGTCVVIGVVIEMSVFLTVCSQGPGPAVLDLVMVVLKKNLGNAANLKSPGDIETVLWRWPLRLMVWSEQ